MNTGETWGLMGGMIGGIGGLIGGLIGTYCSIKNARSGRERSCVRTFAVVCWIVVSVFLGLMWMLPGSYRHFLWIPYSILLPLGVVSMNRKLQRIRQTEEAQ
jgi:uncharacterized membrane protein